MQILILILMIMTELGPESIIKNLKKHGGLSFLEHDKGFDWIKATTAVEQEILGVFILELFLN